MYNVGRGDRRLIPRVQILFAGSYDRHVKRRTQFFIDNDSGEICLDGDFFQHYFDTIEEAVSLFLRWLKRCSAEANDPKVFVVGDNYYISLDQNHMYRLWAE